MNRSPSALQLALVALAVIGLLPTLAVADTALYRVNVGGAAHAALDQEIGWSEDTNAVPSAYVGPGTTVGSFPGSVLDASVPASTPAAIFDTERYDGTDAPEMAWGFPVNYGRTVEVRLYFKNGYSGTSLPGQRVFNVEIDGVSVLTNYDIVADVGSYVGVMKSFTVVSDGQLDIEFLHVVENPLVCGIEIRGEPVPGDTALYRINVGGAYETALDAGINWGEDTNASPSPYSPPGSFADSYPGGTVDASVPASTPPVVFDTQRFDTPGGPAGMFWDFPTVAGQLLEVRLYFKNGWIGTSQPGQRVFNVEIDGVTVLPNYDIAADVGHNVGVMKSFVVVADGNLDIDLLPLVENPLISAIEILGDLQVDDRIARQIGGTLNIHWEMIDGLAGQPIGCSGIEFTDGTLADASDGSVSMSGTSVSVGGCFGTDSYTFTMAPDGLSLSGLAGSVPMTLTRKPGDAAFVGDWIAAGYVYRAHIAADPFPIPDYDPDRLGEWVGWWQEDGDPEISGTVTMTIDAEVWDNGNWLVDGSFTWKRMFGGESSGVETFSAEMATTGEMVISATGLIDAVNLSPGIYAAQRSANGLTITGSTYQSAGPARTWQVSRVSAFNVPAEMPTIQDAADTFWDRPMLRVEVSPGTHNVNLDLAALAASPGVVEIAGTGATNAEAILGGSAGPGQPVVTTNGAGGTYPLVLTNLTVTGGTRTDLSGAGVLGDGGTRFLFVRDCLISNNDCAYFSPTDVVQGGAIATLAGNRARIEGCTFTQNDGGYGGGVLVQDDAVLVDNLFTGNTAYYGGGIGAVAANHTVSVIRCQFLGNGAGQGGGILASGCLPLTVVDCSFVGTDYAISGDGLYAEDSQVLLSRSDFVHCTAENGAAVMLNLPAAGSVIDGCTFGGAGDDFNQAFGVGGAVRIYGPLAPAKGGSGAIAAAPPATGSRRSPGLPVSLVEPLRAGRAKPVQSVTGLQHGRLAPIRLDEPTYSAPPSLEPAGGGRQPRQVADKAGVAYVTIFSSEFHYNYANAGGAVFASRLPSLELTDCTFQVNGTNLSGGAVYVGDTPRLIVQGCAFTGNYCTGDTGTAGGGALFAVRSDSIAIRATEFDGNQADDYAGAVFIDGDDVIPLSLVLEDLTFTNNGCGGNGGALWMQRLGPGVATMNNCDFVGNWAWGAVGALALLAGQSTPGELRMQGSSLIDNRADVGVGGALLVPRGGSVYAESCTFAQNWTNGSGGGIQVQDGLATFVNSLISDNAAYGTTTQDVSPFAGGGLVVWGFAGQPAGEAQLINCAVVGNHMTGTDPTDGGGGIGALGGRVDVFNSILWGNTAQNGSLEEQQFRVGDYDTFTGAGTLRNAIVEGLDPGTTTFAPGPFWGDDPRFVDLAGGDLRLTGISPAIGAGDNTLLPAGVTTDLDGGTRIIGVTVDLGPYEHDGVSSVDDGPGNDLPAVSLLRSAYPNPFNPRVTIAFALDREQQARVAVYDVQGRLVKVLREGVMAAGAASVVWDGTGPGGARMASGVYLVELRAGPVSDRRTVTLVK